MCSICPSTAPIAARNLCRPCYRKLQYLGLLNAHPVKSTRDRFDSHYTKTAGCWLWHGAINDAGYGIFTDKRGVPQRAHRVMWQFERGEIPNRLLVCHTCDVRNCVNPDHLFLGTIQDNLADMRAKDRHARGETNGKATLSDAQVEIIRADPRTQVAIGRDYGITQGTVSRIKSGKRWGHL